LLIIKLQSICKPQMKRPIFRHASFDNFGLQKFLEQCGFVKIGTAECFANAR